jgi:hypothetical protein
VSKTGWGHWVSAWNVLKVMALAFGASFFEAFEELGEIIAIGRSYYEIVFTCF